MSRNWTLRPIAPAGQAPATPAPHFGATAPLASTPFSGYVAAPPLGYAPFNPFASLASFVTFATAGAPPAPSLVLGRLGLSCAQWLALAPAIQASLVRGALEKLGFASFNGYNRGDVVYKLVDQMTGYCRAAMMMPAGRAPSRTLLRTGRRG